MIPTPPRLTGDPNQDLPAIVSWAWLLYRELAVQNPDTRRLDTIGNLPALPESGAPADSIAATVNAIILASKKGA